MNPLILTLVLLNPVAGQITGSTSAQTSAKPGIQVFGQNAAAPTGQSPAPRLPQTDKSNPIDDSGIIVQTRGPLHEAFAQPIDRNPTPTTVVPKAPPPPVPELPPGEKPEGANVQWIPGYWGWDPEKKDYVWVSGVWRNAPPGRSWTSGYWNKAGDGWQWTTGYWGDSKQKKPNYQPEPPDSLDQGPSQPAPNENYFYIPAPGSTRMAITFGVPVFGILPSKTGSMWPRITTTRRPALSIRTAIGIIPSTIAAPSMPRSFSISLIGTTRIGIISPTMR